MKTWQKRFDSHVSIEGDCWLWTASTCGAGYGKFWARGKMYSSHRLSYERHKGDIPPGMFVCHACDNKLCVNPSHLFLGTPKDNSEDMARKGRSCRGERQPNSKLKAKDVIEIRRLAILRISQDEIARIFGTSQPVISNIVRRKRWTHV